SAVNMKLNGCETGLQNWGSPAVMPPTPAQRLRQEPLLPLLMSPPPPPPPLTHSLPLLPDLHYMHTKMRNSAANSPDAISTGIGGANMYSGNVYGGASGSGNDGGIGDAPVQMEVFSYLTAQHVQLLAAAAPHSSESQLQPEPRQPTLPQPAPLQNFPYQHSQHGLGSCCRHQVEIPELQSPEQQHQQLQQCPDVELPHPQPPRGQVEVLQPGQSLGSQPFPMAAEASIPSELAAPSPLSRAFDSSLLTHMVTTGP
ncbi:hypothetical protein Vafri_11894, partial [Volvox africanus]